MLCSKEMIRFIWQNKGEDSVPACLEGIVRNPLVDSQLGTNLSQKATGMGIFLLQMPRTSWRAEIPG